MAEPINLNKARKAKARAEAGGKAAENRAKFGRTKADKDLAAARDDLARRRLEALKRED